MVNSSLLAYFLVRILLFYCFYFFRFPFVRFIFLAGRFISRGLVFFEFIVYSSSLPSFACSTLVSFVPTRIHATETIASGLGTFRGARRVAWTAGGAQWFSIPTRELLTRTVLAPRLCFAIHSNSIHRMLLAFWNSVDKRTLSYARFIGNILATSRMQAPNFCLSTVESIRRKSRREMEKRRRALRGILIRSRRALHECVKSRRPVHVT